MALILSLETSTDVCSVALHKDGNLLAEAEVREAQSHAAKLALMISKIVEASATALKDIGAVALAKGPGSYTGLRIGTSTAKGLCYALDIPLIGVGTLDLLAFQASSLNPSNALLCPMIDARRMEVYTMVVNQKLEMIQPVTATVVGPDSFQELLQRQEMLFFGNGSDKCRELLRHPNARFISGIFPIASALGELAEKKYGAGLFEDLISFNPFYLKEFVAGRPQLPI